MPKKLSTTEFITRATIIHKGKYNYDLVSYINALIPIKIICSMHGIFEQGPSRHLQGHGCKECYDARRGRTIAFTTEKYIEKAKEIHGEKYDYSITEYINSLTKIKIKCYIHGEFIVSPNDHLHAKSGCTRCSGNYVKNYEEFLQNAKIMHDEKYDYSLVNFDDKNIIIICPVHGNFIQNKLHHLRGGGCKKCGYARAIDIKIQKGLITNPNDRDPFLKYRSIVRDLSNKNYIKYYYDINPDNLRRGKEYHLDHIKSIMSGFIEGIPPEDIASPKNLRVIKSIENISKGVKSVNAESNFDENNIVTQQINDSAHNIKRFKRSNRYQITDLINTSVIIVDSLGDWCFDNNLS